MNEVGGNGCQCGLWEQLAAPLVYPLSPPSPWWEREFIRSLTRLRCWSLSLRSSRIMRLPRARRVSEWRSPLATCSMSLAVETLGLVSSDLVSVLSVSVTPTQSTRTKRLLPGASGVTLCSSSRLMTRVPRPFICS